MKIAHLADPDGDRNGFQALSEEFERRNRGYRLGFTRGLKHLDSGGHSRVVFVLDGTSDAVVGSVSSAIGVGDVLIQRSGEELAILGDPIDVVVFSVPEVPPAEIPAFLRPDHDPVFGDQPGGCATDGGAYRRVVLTWLGQNGPYNYRALNTHRVRMTDSFSHYHPRENGFDEMYLVQGVEPGAHVITSDRVDLIERPDDVAVDDVASLVQRTPVAVGDLMYVGRGEMHRGVGGVLAHVITVPGFIPGAEIGVDHHLRAINERLGLTGERALPFHAAASDGPVVK